MEHARARLGARAEAPATLADSSGVRSRDPTTLIRIVLRGARSVATKQEPTAPGMPSFGRQLNDEQIAAVASYVRNAWGRPAAAVAPGDVTSTATSLQNWDAGVTQIANSITVPLGSTATTNRHITVFMGDQDGAADIIVDVFGYYL